MNTISDLFSVTGIKADREISWQTTSHSHSIFSMFDFRISNHFRFNWTSGILITCVIWFYYSYDHEVATIKTNWL